MNIFYKMSCFSSKQGGVTHSRVGIKVWHFTYFANTIPGRFNVKKKKIPALFSFEAIGGEGYFRKYLTQFFGLDYCSCHHTLILIFQSVFPQTVSEKTLTFLKQLFARVYPILYDIWFTRHHFALVKKISTDCNLKLL